VDLAFDSCLGISGVCWITCGFLIWCCIDVSGASGVVGGCCLVGWWVCGVWLLLVAYGRCGFVRIDW